MSEQLTKELRCIECERPRDHGARPQEIEEMRDHSATLETSNRRLRAKLDQRINQ